MVKAILSADGMRSVVTVASSGAGIYPVSCQSLFPETEKEDPSSAAKYDQSV